MDVYLLICNNSFWRGELVSKRGVCCWKKKPAKEEDYDGEAGSDTRKKSGREAG